MITLISFVVILLFVCILLIGLVKAQDRGNIGDKGIIGYILLILSVAFFHVPILGLLALPVFIISIIICAIFLLSLCDDQVNNKRRWFGGFLIAIGIITLSGVLAYAVVKFGHHFAAWVGLGHPRLKLQDVFTIFTLNIIASGVIVLGVRQRSGWKGRKIFLAWFMIFLAVPLAIAVMKLLEILGLPLTA